MKSPQIITPGTQGHRDTGTRGRFSCPLADYFLFLIRDTIKRTTDSKPAIVVIKFACFVKT